METAKLTDRHYTKEAYLDLVQRSLHKYEYLDGRVRMMAGGTAAHNLITGNAYYAIRSRSKKCLVLNSETAVAVSAINRYFFPDASVVCDKKATYEDGPGIARLTNPSLVIEVLSESSQSYDRTEKFSAYRHLESFREYLLIDSQRHYAETYYREERDLWRIGNYFELEQAVNLYTPNIEVPLRDFYEGVNLTE